MMETGPHGEAGVEAGVGVGAEAEEATTWRIPSITALMVVGVAVVVEAGVGVGVGTVVEAESKSPVALTSPVLMRLREVGEVIFLRRCRTLVAAEEGAEAEVRGEVRGEGIALTALLQIPLRQELPKCRLAECRHSGIICLEVALLKVVEGGSSRYMCVIFWR